MIKNLTFTPLMYVLFIQNYFFIALIAIFQLMTYNEGEYAFFGEEISKYVTLIMILTFLPIIYWGIQLIRGITQSIKKRRKDK